jgi:uncharacterized phage protein (TIGR02218 family)
MKTASPELITFLNTSNAIVVADLITITPRIGTPLRITGHDMPIASGADTWLPAVFSRGRTRSSLGLEVDTFDVTLWPREGDVLNGVALAVAANNGGFDGARIALHRAYAASFDSAVVGTLLKFEGRVSDVQADRGEVRLKGKSDIEVLNIKLPRHVHQAQCMHTVFKGGCGLVRASWAVAGTVESGSTRSLIDSTLTVADGYFDLGVIEFNTGPNAGVIAGVKSYAGGNFTLAFPLVAAPVAGNTFTAYPGCPRTMSVCQSRFSNLANFRATPFVPAPETAI